MAPLDISIILVNWNARQLVLDCLDSTCPELKPFNHEIIVVDNASSDGSTEAIRQKYPFVKIIQLTKNVGFAKGNNAGLRESKGEFICLMNTDVIVLPGCFEKLIGYLRTNMQVGICGPKVLNSDHSLQTSCRKEVTLFRAFARSLGLDSIFPLINYYEINDTIEVDVLSGCFWMVRREALENVGGLDDNFFFYGEDRDWCFRFRKAGWRVVYFPHSIIIHSGGGSSHTENYKYYIFLEKASFQYWKKFHSRTSLAIYWMIRVNHQILRILGRLIMFLIKSNPKLEYKTKTIRSIYCLIWLFGFKPKFLQQI